MTKKQKQEFLEIYKKSKTSPTGEGDRSHSTKPSDFSGAPKPDTSIVVVPKEETVKPLPCESYADQWLSTLSSTDALGCVVAATMLHIDQHREKCAFPLIPNACTCRPVNRKEIEENPKAKQALQQEWDRLRSRKAWGETNPREWSEWDRPYCG